MIKSLIAIRRRFAAIRHGDYAQLHVASEQFAFIRRDPAGAIVVAVNAAKRPVKIDLRIPDIANGQLIDALNDGETFSIINGRCALPVPPCRGRILEVH